MTSFGTILLAQATKSTLILLAAGLATLLLRRASASARRLVWVVAAVSLLALPLLSVALPSLAISAFWTNPSWTAPASQPADTVITVHANAPPPGHSPQAPMPWLAIAWLAGAAAILGRWIIGWARMSWLAARARILERDEEMRELQSRIGVRSVRFFESRRTVMPMTIGIARPAILLPDTQTEWPAERRRLILAHELIHVRQHDCLLQLLMQAACALYWFHPLVWVAAAQFRKERERACDDGVLNLGVAGPDYAGHLLELVRSLKPGPRPAMAVAMAQSHLEDRLVALLDEKVNRSAVTRKTVLAALLAAVCLLAPLASLRAQPSVTTGNIAGGVYDPTGAVVPGAIVVATRTDAPGKEQAVSDAVGQYSFQSIPLGRYTLEVSLPGFRVFRKTDILVKPGEAARVDALMEIGHISERIRVTGLKPAGLAQAPSAPPRRIRVGGNVVAAKLISRVLPEYPEIAKQQGIEGTVLLQAVISKEGSVLSLAVMNATANPDLAQAARTAVHQWRYEPTLLNGEPVEVLTTITVDFQLRP